MKNKKIIFAIILIVILILLALIYAFGNKNNLFSDNNENNTLQGQNTTNSVSIINNPTEEVDSNDEYSNWKNENVSYIELKNDSATGTGVSITDTTIKITNAGNYCLSGTLDNGTIIIDSTGVVRLILNNANISSSNTAAINVKNAEKVIISLEEGTTNTITDSENYVYDDIAEEEPDGTIFSKDDLTINGTGTLNVNANFKDAIVSKDTLKIMSGTININSVGDGIRGKDCVIIKSGNITINAENDGIKSTNDTDTTLGYIVIDTGTFNINATQDGIQAETSLVINGGNFNITTNNGVSTANVTNNYGGFGATTYSTDEVSRKALKANTGILIVAGEFKINSADDSIHSNADITIQNGTFEISSGDDGIHSDSKLTINNGTINITKSYEGLEGTQIEINGGNIKLKTSDDGLNAAGGNDSSSINGRPGQNNFVATSNANITINGGDLYINSAGDGIDSNGSVYINGGTATVDGPTDSGNGALDYTSEFKMTGGTLIAVGSVGMMQTISTSSTVYCISAVFPTTQTAGTTISIKNSSGSEILEYTPSKQFQSAVIATSKIEKGESYTVYMDTEELSTVTINNIITSVGSSMSAGGMQNGAMPNEGIPNEGMMNDGGQKRQNR